MSRQVTGTDVKSGFLLHGHCSICTSSRGKGEYYKRHEMGLGYGGLTPSINMEWRYLVKNVNAVL